MCCKPFTNLYFPAKNVLGLVVVLLVAGLLFAPAKLRAQDKYTISGSIKDSLSGENLIGATITTLEVKKAGVLSNDFGFYSFNLPGGDYTLQISYVGYRTVLMNISLHQNMVINQAMVLDNALQA